MSSLDFNSDVGVYREIHLMGMGVGHSLSPAHNSFVAQSIDVPWKVFATECPATQDCVRVFRSANLAGGIVTMPCKGEITQYPDRLDDTTSILKAVNVVYFDEKKNLCGGNTDWFGIEGALRVAGVIKTSSKDGNGLAAVIGAGGAASAAIYALSTCFEMESIYILNRDHEGVARLVEDCV